MSQKPVNTIDPAQATRKLEMLEDLQRHPGFAILMGVIDSHLSSSLLTGTTDINPNVVMRAMGAVAVCREIKNFVPENIAALKMQLAPKDPQKKEK